MAGVTKCMMVAFERECRNLTVEEMGALWALTAATECGWFGRGGQIRIAANAAAALLNMDEDRSGHVRQLVESMRRKGKIRAREYDGGRMLEIEVCLWSDQWARERAKKRR